MKMCRAMKKWPEFVQEEDAKAPRAIALGELTGWETVIFELADDQEDGLSALATASLAP
jgi:hypothetical protein